MPQIPNRLQPDTSLSDNLALINDNFDKTVQDMTDLGSKFSDTGSSSLTVPANTSYSISVNFVDSRNITVPGKTEVIPRVDCRVDVDSGTYRLPDGGSLSAAQQNANCFVRVSRTVPSSIVTANVIITVANYDSATHVYYLYYDVSYKASPTTGVLR